MTDLDPAPGANRKDNRQEHQPESSRRRFLEGVGAFSVAAVGSALLPQSAEAAPKPQWEIPLSSFGDVHVTRHELFAVPGGKEVFTEWSMKAPDGSTRKYLVHHSRVDADVTYNVNTSIKVHHFNPGISVTGDPTSTRQQNISIYAIKGQIDGNVRDDHMTTTVIQADGSTTRTSAVVPVRLDMGDLDTMDITTVLQTMRTKVVEAHQ